MYRDARMRLVWAKADRPLIAQNRTVSQSKLMAGSGTLPPFAPDMANGSSRQKPIFSGRSAATVEQPKLVRFRTVGFQSWVLESRHLSTSNAAVYVGRRGGGE